MNCGKVFWLVMIPSVLSAPLVGAEGFELDKRYRAPLQGFSLCPPRDTEQTKPPSPSVLVRWSKRDPKTGAIVWTLTVERMLVKQTDIELGSYSRALAEKLGKAKNFTVESVNVLPAPGKGSIHIAGVESGVLNSWQRRVWILAKPGRFLVLTVSGPSDMKQKLNAICEAVLGTFEIIDREAALEARQKNLVRGQDLLASLGHEELKKAVRPSPQWFLVKKDEKVVGFVKVEESIETRSKVPGVSVVQYLTVQLPTDPIRLIKQEAFSTADRSVEMWTERLEVGEGPGAQWTVEEGLKQSELIVCNIKGPNGEQTKNRKAPEEIYLPRALAKLLPRLVDLNQPSAYSFAVYTSPVNDFDMRTFRVIGKDTLMLDGEKRACIRVTDQAAADVEPIRQWVDQQGNLLRIKANDGTTMEAVSLPKVLRHFHQAESYVERMDRLGK